MGGWDLSSVFIIFMIHIDCYLVLTFLEGNCDFTTYLMLGSPWINIKLVAHVTVVPSFPTYYM